MPVLFIEAPRAFARRLRKRWWRRSRLRSMRPTTSVTPRSSFVNTPLKMWRWMGASSRKPQNPGDSQEDLCHRLGPNFASPETGSP